MDIGRTPLDLELIDYLPQILSFLGIVGIIAGGVLAGCPTWQARITVPPPARGHAADDRRPATGRPRRTTAGCTARTARAAGRPADPARLTLGARASGHRALAERHARAAVALGDDLGQDREGRLGRRAAAEVEPDRAAQPGQVRLG